MARCERGYLCQGCGGEVEEITSSDLYLAYVLGEVPAEALLTRPERHILCNPERAQYIVHPDFPPVPCQGAFAKAGVDPDFVAEEEARVTRAWLRLQQVQALGLPIEEYPL